MKKYGQFLKSILPVLLFLLVVSFLWRGLNRNPHEIPSPLIGKPIPKFSAETLANSKITINETALKGKVSLLNVFATWCASCQAEHSVLMDIRDSHRVNIYGLNYKDNRMNAKQWLRRFGNPYTNVIYDPTGQVGIQFGVYGTPETFIIGRNGDIRYKYIGPISPSEWKNTIRPEVEKLQKETA